MGSVYYLWFTRTFVLFQFLHNSLINMKAFIILAVAAMGYAAPAADPQLLQSGLPAGPLTPAWGNGVLTPRGVRPINLEGFSEDVNQDGFVDPIGHAVAPVAVAAPVHYAAPAHYVHHAVVHRPVATHTYTVPVSTHVETTHVGTHTYTNTLPHVFGAGAPILGGLPVVAAAKPAEEAAVAEE